MSSYLSSLLTTTTSRYASIKQTLLASEADGETEDDTNVCRTLRNYYTEKGRPFPGWLPPDPKAPPPPVIAPTYTSQNVGAGYGQLGNGPATTGSSRLNSLWDAGRGDPQSLRNGNIVRQGAAVRSGGQRSPFDRSQTASEPPPQARPLPSQRAGSYQTQTGRMEPAMASGGSAQDRLKARFGQKSTPRMGVQSASSYGSTASSGSGQGGSGSSYEDSLRPGNYGGGGQVGGGGGLSPAAAAQPAGGRMGLPSGPGARRGLPSGPRSMR